MNRISLADETRSLSTSMLCTVIVCLVSFALQAHAAQSAPAARVLVLSGGTLIDGTGRSPLREAVVVIRGDRIEAVGRRGQLGIPDGAEILDTSNRFILPGLIDSHFHYYDWMSVSGEVFLDFGVTSTYHFGAAIPEVKPPGEDVPNWPRLFFSGPKVATPAEWTLLGKVEIVGNVTRPEQARELVRQNKASGVTFIMVSENLTPEMLSAATQEAHALGLSVIGHQVNAAAAIEAGTDGIEHTTGIAFAAIKDQELVARLAELQKKSPKYGVSHPISNPEYYMDMNEVKKILRAMVERGVYLNPTLVTRWQRVYPETAQFRREYEIMSRSPALHFVPERGRQNWLRSLVPYPEWTDTEHKEQEREGYRKTQEMLRQFAKAGGKILAGTDISDVAVPGLRLHQELLLLVEAGLTPMQAILTATLYPAQFLHREKEFGTVEPGKLADLLVVDADPLERIQNLRRISRVYLGGKLVPMRFRPDSLAPAAPASECPGVGRP